jgi:hypothetical protein
MMFSLKTFDQVLWFINQYCQYIKQCLTNQFYLISKVRERLLLSLAFSLISFPLLINILNNFIFSERKFFYFSSLWRLSRFPICCICSTWTSTQRLLILSNIWFCWRSNTSTATSH